MPHLYFGHINAYYLRCMAHRCVKSCQTKHKKFEFISTFLAVMDAFVKEEELLLRDEDVLLIMMNNLAVFSYS